MRDNYVILSTERKRETKTSTIIMTGSKETSAIIKTEKEKEIKKND